jgi:hypothetical protein
MTMIRGFVSTPIALAALAALCASCAEQVVQADGLAWSTNEEIESILQLDWNQLSPALTWVEYSFDEGVWLQSPPVERDEGAHQELLLGIPYDTDVRIRVVNDLGKGPLYTEEMTAQTGNIPRQFPMPELLAADAERWDPTGNYLLGSINLEDGGWIPGRFWKFILDRQGRVVWTHMTPDDHWTIFMRPSLDGTAFLWDEATFWSDWDEGRGSEVHRMTIDGNIVESYSTPGLHHAFTELPGGSLVWGSASWSNETLEELQPDGGRRQLWNCRDFGLPDLTANGCQSNTLFYDEVKDTFLYSFYTSETVVEVDRQSGNTLRWWGHVEGPWVFDPPESIFWWQHGVHYLDNGNMLVSTRLDEDTEETVVREYVVDDANQTLTEVWSFGEGEGIYAETAGEAHRLGNGNTLHNYGSGGRLREVTTTGEVVWDVAWEGNKLLGRTVLLEDLYDFAP